MESVAVYIHVIIVKNGFCRYVPSYNIHVLRMYGFWILCKHLFSSFMSSSSSLVLF